MPSDIDEMTSAMVSHRCVMLILIRSNQYKAIVGLIYMNRLPKGELFPIIIRID